MHYENHYYSDFRKHLEENLDAVNDSQEIMIVSRKKGKMCSDGSGRVQSVQEPLHLVSTAANRSRLSEAMAGMQAGGGIGGRLMED